MTEMLFCLPHAGSGASFYRAWSAHDLGFTVYPVQLPGREELFGEPFYRDLPDAVTDIAGRIAGTAGRDDRVSLLGHSFGALLGYEVAHRLSAMGVPVARLVVSGCADPFASLEPIPADLPDEDFVARVEHLAGYVHPALSDPDLRDLVLPALRADALLRETYRATESALPVPITAVRGRDDHLVSAEECRAWQGATSVGCTVEELPGGHMYLAERPEPLFAVLRRLAATEAVDA